MNNKPKKLEDLISEIRAYFKDDRRVADNTICSYRTYWRKFEKYLLTHEIVLVDATVCKGYLFHLFEDKDLKTLTGYEKMNLMVINDLIEFQEVGTVLRIKDIQIVLDGPVGKFMTEYIADRCAQRYSQQTIYMYRLYLSDFLNYLLQNNIRSIKEVNELHLLMYFKSFKPQKQATASRTIIVIRGFFNFLYRQEILDTDYSRIIPKNGYKQQAKLPSTYATDEITKLIDSIDRACATGKRNYPIILLAAKLGLRASDIANLQFNNVDWTQSAIKLAQYKTGRPLELPLLPEVGNAIIDYLRYGRPKSNSQYVFLLAVAPYKELLPTSIYTIVKQAFSSTDINTLHKKRGPHALRHSLAGRLLENKTTLPVISEVLGHENTETTRYYLRVDLQSLRHCVLDVPTVPISFYTHKGGYFYA
jgi:site-specific recombinase XerD